MARRYSGSVTIYIEHDPLGCAYKCNVVTPDGSRIIHVGEPRMLEQAVDSPPAFDAVSHAALSFASDEDERNERNRHTGCEDIGVDSHAWMTDTGWHTSRKREV